MGQAKGSKSKLLVGTEATFKTIANSNPLVLPFVSESLKLSRNLIESKTIRGNRNPLNPVRGNSEVTGDVTVEMTPYMGKMFYHALGTFSTTGASPYSHTFVISDLPPGLTIEKQFIDLDTPEYFTYAGCKINSMKMSFASEGFIETVFSVMGSAQTVTVSAKLTGALDYSDDAVGQQFDNFQATIKEGGATLGIVTKLDISIENNLDGSVYVIDGTGSRYSLPEGLVKVSGTLTALFQDVTLYNKAVNNAESSLQVTLTQGTGTGAAYNEKLDIWIDELLYSPADPVITGPAGIMVELPFIGYYNNGASASAFRLILWNTQSQSQVQ
jgi:hypothetical protein